MSAKVVDMEARRKRRFSEFASEVCVLDGEKMTIEAVLNREIEVIGYKIKPSKYSKNETGMCLMLQFILGGERRVMFTGSDVLVEQMRQYGDQMPFLTTIKKIDRYFTLS